MRVQLMLIKLHNYRLQPKMLIKFSFNGGAMQTSANQLWTARHTSTCFILGILLAQSTVACSIHIEIILYIPCSLQVVEWWRIPMLWAGNAGDKISISYKHVIHKCLTHKCADFKIPPSHTHTHTHTHTHIPNEHKQPRSCDQHFRF